MPLAESLCLDCGISKSEQSAPYACCGPTIIIIIINNEYRHQILFEFHGCSRVLVEAVLELSFCILVFGVGQL